MWCIGRRGTLFWIVLVCTLQLGRVAVKAQAQDGESPAYRELVEQALQEYARQNFEEASSLFTRAHQLYPNARTQRGLGMTAFELRRYPESIAQLQLALASQIKPLDAQLRADTETLLHRARGFVATVTVDVQPRDAELRLDGEPVAPFTPLVVALGEHVLELQKPGYVSERRVVRLHGGERLEPRLTLALDNLSRAHAPQRADDARTPRHALYKNGWLWTGVGVLVAGAVSAGVLLGTRGHDQTRTVAEGTANTPPGVSLSSQGAR
jgi:tetratricopeptide (TPR) repeat protein